LTDRVRLGRIVDIHHPASFSSHSTPGDAGAPRAADGYKTLREIAQEEIKRDIVEGRLLPGAKLAEADLAQRYGVRRGPIREALRALEGEGLLRSMSNRGAEVVRLSAEEVAEVYEIRTVLEGLAARLAAPKLTDAKLAELTALHAEMDRALAVPSVWMRLNTSFHLSLYSASGRPRLNRQIGDLMNIVEPQVRRFLDMPEKLLDTHSDHRLILEAATRRNGSECESMIHQHLERAAAVIIDLAASSEARTATPPDPRGQIEQPLGK
jgi:DNA-binding GntR family transcriptional regulator